MAKHKITWEEVDTDGPNYVYEFRCSACAWRTKYTFKELPLGHDMPIARRVRIVAARMDAFLHKFAHSLFTGFVGGKEMTLSQQKLVDRLVARGMKIVPCQTDTPYPLYVTLVAPDGYYYFVGRYGVLWRGETAAFMVSELFKLEDE